MTTTSDLAKLEAQITELQAKRDAILDEHRTTKLNEVKAIVKQFRFTASDLGLAAAGTRGKGATAAVKAVHEARYANPADPKQTWHGKKGPKPSWVKAHLETGGNLEDLLIKK